MTRSELTAYFTGIIDGEGCIGLHSRGAGKGRKAVIEVKMTCETTIIALRNHFNEGTVRQRKVPDGRKPQWVWRVTDRKARTVYAEIKPYLLTKKAIGEQVFGH
jgi:hypothetical protein